MSHHKESYYENGFAQSAHSRIPSNSYISTNPNSYTRNSNDLSQQQNSFPQPESLVRHNNNSNNLPQNPNANYSYIVPNSNNSHNEMNFGHFAITTARYPEPWQQSPVPNYSQFLPVQTAPRNNYDYAQQQQQSHYHNQPPQQSTFSINDALMLPPPSPNILSYYMYDHALNNFPNRDFTPEFHLPPSLWTPDMVPNQYMLPPIQSAPGLPQQYRNHAKAAGGYPIVYGSSQWGGPRWSAGGVMGVNQPQPPPSAGTFGGVPSNVAQYPGTFATDAHHPNYDRHTLGNLQVAPSYIPIDLNRTAAAAGGFGGGGSLAYSAPLLPLVPGTNVSIKDAGTVIWRDHLLQYAHSIYTSAPQSPSLLPMLNALNQLHPNHLPILLLTACVHYAQGNFQTSLKFHSMILEIDPNYVEAMSNIGTTLRSMGNDKEAEDYWRRAINLKPTYWDAIENLMGLLTLAKPNLTTNLPGQPRYDEAYTLCSFVEHHVVGTLSFEDFSRSATRLLPAAQLPRFQNLLYTKGNMCYATGKVEEARVEYEKALQLIFGGRSVMEIIADIIRIYLGVSSRPDELSRFEFPRESNLLLAPPHCLQVASRVFPDTNGALPGLAELMRPQGDTSNQASVATTNQTTSAIILTLAKLYQDICVNIQPLPLLLPLYYLSMSLSPSPSTCNNLGILLSNIPAPAPTHQQPALSGTALALQYYTYGLSLDPRHPHLYTNLGSLLKDMGNINEAIRMYEKAVECNPKFDVALANLGNALKDSGRTQESIQWYRKAVEINPEFIEAVCGLVNALGGVCDWRGRTSTPTSIGWIDRIGQIVDKQLSSGADWGRGLLFTANTKSLVNDLLRSFQGSDSENLWPLRATHWERLHGQSITNQGGWIMRSIEHGLRHLQRRWYLAFYRANHFSLRIDFNKLSAQDIEEYRRPSLPRLPMPPLPTVLPFHTFTYPLTPRQIRLISHRNALRISHSVLSSPWLPPTVYPPPPPPVRRIKLGYVSSDFNNHPLAHLMQSVFGFHNQEQFEVFCYATTPPDLSPYRAKIQASTPHFFDVSGWSTQAIVEKIVSDGIHILINLNGYTKGARNEVFAARPAPVLMAYMGFAGTLGGNWCDWFIADPVVCPPSMVGTDQYLQRKVASHDSAGSASKPSLNQIDSIDIDPEENSDSWVYTERLIYLPHSYFVNDHRQGFRDPEDASFMENRLPQHPLTRPRELVELDWLREEDRRWRMRRELFPALPDDYIIFANFNQLYKIDPSIFNTWLTILHRVPKSILWLLRFPAAGEVHLKETAERSFGPELAARVIFTDVAPKQVHIHRGRVADLFFDTPECNAHTTAADILWSGTPIVTYARHVYKMCSRVAASIAYATGYGHLMVVPSEEAYADLAVEMANSVDYDYVKATENEVILKKLKLTSSPHLTANDSTATDHRIGKGSLIDLRKALFLTRDHSRLFDTPRWVKNLESGYLEAWRRWENQLDDQPFTMTYPSTASLPTSSSERKKSTDTQDPPLYIMPQYRNHLQEHLKERWGSGQQIVQSGCIWIHDDEESYYQSDTLISTDNPVDVDSRKSTISLGSNQNQTNEPTHNPGLNRLAAAPPQPPPGNGCAIPSA